MKHSCFNIQGQLGSVGAIYTATVIKIVDGIGAVVEYQGREGLVHISRLAKTRTEKVEDVVKVGDVVRVKFMGYDEKRGGKEILSMKDAE